MTNIVGVDPGLKGGIAILNLENGVPVAAFKMPIKKRKLNLGEIRTILIACNIKIGVIETAFRDGVKNAAKTEAVFELCGVPIVNYHPRIWQKIIKPFREYEADTKQAAYACCLANSLPVPIGKKGNFHDGIADAWCIALYHWQLINGDLK